MASDGGITQTAKDQNLTAAGQSQAAYNQVAPKYAQFVNDPQGFTPQQKQNMLTSTLQTNGGSTAGAVGQGGLFAARTNNAGGAAEAIADAARAGDVGATNAALGIENQDALLARQQQQLGLAGEQSLYSGGNDAANAALGIANSSQQGNSLTKQLISAGGQIGGAYAGR